MQTVIFSATSLISPGAPGSCRGFTCYETTRNLTTLAHVLLDGSYLLLHNTKVSCFAVKKNKIYAKPALL